ncbi:MAG: hypothetical protein HY785_28405 [Oscillatoriophycideae cyanobacterium NC_groundwater_1537_Pr4_S-0.65um_50_18]|nr:hypothetical protein [Oscillatoriophycideae cyanobacterium NC_groundwater_1537_Pr4_S-0.65um_50_18]
MGSASQKGDRVTLAGAGLLCGKQVTARNLTHIGFLMCFVRSQFHSVTRRSP